ncbi:pentapeptide repeat-containing protein, partial [Mycobacterium tuberculosis]|nr:pentapeptide repeat-containing protein [Mycobacterium tuberculosis]
FDFANLHHTSLADCELKHAKLDNTNIDTTIFNGSRLEYAQIDGDVMMLYGYQWFVSARHGMLKIGCQCHLVETWENFSDEEIEKMSSDALVFWQEYKN